MPIRRSPFRRERQIGETGRQSEKLGLKSLGAKATPASGASWVKGDGEVAGYLVEVKSTTADSFSVKLEHLAKVAGDAIDKGRRPALAVRFVKPDGSLRTAGDWVMVRASVFSELCNQLHEEEP